MNNSKRAQERRRKRSKLSKGQRDQLSRQHFGDQHVIRGLGRPMFKGEDKKNTLAARNMEHLGWFGHGD